MLPTRRATLGLCLAALFLVVRYYWATGIHWINDDFIFLDHARQSGFLDLWGFDDALGNAYRPLTRNLYFWLGLHLFGSRPAPYHLLNLGLALAGLGLCFLVLRRLVAGAAARAQGTPLAAQLAAAEGPALAGTLLFAAHPAAATPLSWVCGVQDVLGAALALAAMLAHLRGRRLAYLLLLAAALASKELAASLPALLWLHDVAVRREKLREATRRQLPALLLLVVWAAGNRWLPWNDLGSTIHSAVAGERTLLGRFDLGTVWLTVRALLLAAPYEAFAWPYGRAATAGMALAAGGVVVVAAQAPWPRRLPWSLAFWALLWSLSGIVPLVTVISHFVYYAYYPALGAALAAALLLARLAPARRPRAVRTAALAALAALLTAGAGLRHDAAQCDAHNIRRASGYLWQFRADLLAARPALPDSARCYFWNIPYYIGFQLADGPALRLWYDNPTLEGRFLSEYTPSFTRPSFFFGYDDAGGLVEIIRGLPDPQLAAPPPIYGAAHADLGTRLVESGETDAAIVEWRKALEVQPRLGAVRYNLALTLTREGRFAEAAPALEQALALEPGRPELALALAVAEANLGRVASARQRLRALAAAAADSPERTEARRLLEQLGGGAPAAGAPPER